MRLADLEAQMEYEFAKYTQLVKKQKMLQVQYEVTENLPVGIECLKEDLEKLEAKHEEAAELYGAGE
jgi:hypothetical protein